MSLHLHSDRRGQSLSVPLAAPSARVICNEDLVQDGAATRALKEIADRHCLTDYPRAAFLCVRALNERDLAAVARGAHAYLEGMPVDVRAKRVVVGPVNSRLENLIAGTDARIAACRAIAPRPGWDSVLSGPIARGLFPGRMHGALRSAGVCTWEGLSRMTVVAYLTTSGLGEYGLMCLRVLFSDLAAVSAQRGYQDQNLDGLMQRFSANVVAKRKGPSRRGF